MNFRRSSLRAMSIRHDKVRFGSRPAAITAAAAFALALLGVGAGNAVAAPAGATIAPDAASAVVAVAAGTQYTVHAGQSLNDVAIAVTLSHDRAVLARATRALFDTNPAAFMNHDPSRMRVGAVLIVPALDASGALAASSGGAAAGASESSAAAPASAPMAAPAAAAASTASAVAQVNAATASAASAAAPAATPAAPAVSGAAAGGGLSSAPAGQAPSAASATAPATTAARAASQPHPKVSSLQQLLALKNRVLMELQKHGIGGAPVASSPAPTSAAQPAAPGSAAAATVVPEHANVAMSPSDEGGMSQRELSIAAAVGAALVVLLAALRMSRRKREKEAAARAAEAVDAERTRSAREADSRDGSAVAGHPVTEGSDARDQEVARQAAAAAAAERAAAESAAAERAAAESAAAAEEAAERAAAERVAAERAAAEQAAAEQAGAEQAAAEHAAAEHAAAEQAAAERIAAERAAAELAAQQGGTPEPAAPTAPLASIPLSTGSEPSAESRAVAPAHDETLRSAATAANLAAAAELGADALPLGPLEPVIGGTEDEGAHRPKWDDESTESPTDKTTGTPATPTPSPTETPSVAPHIATAEPQPPLDVPPPVIDFTQHQIEPRTTTAFAQPFSDIPVPAQPAPSTPTDFPRDAVDAFGSLNMPLPPRIEAPTAGETERPTSLSTQPVASPDTTAQQSIGVHGADDDAPHIADQIAAGTAGHGAVAGLGAAGFGALKLDFDLELPPSPAQPLPAFTAADLGRIARNKLELASEYIELGDLAGARALINEVIEANDPATRNEARALLSTLAPLS
ncbi:MULTISPECIES: FimV/HubP family polar landmark protein [Paraburkholderia]|uniref:Fimbrial protein FimV n=1 Tax=Paraburkholderia podalyriae TaxID=1938811 RepID=A0ABR7PWD3_9BURK|nr:FimV/HubP family polar landmark protein [Paraburkholderia podalyriae]MBC8750597.1 fimbrial protein FimV [Paraburkholderia podalyriae]